MSYLFFDTETTGFSVKHLPKGHPLQPHLVQLACLLTDDAGCTLSSCDLTVIPEGFEIPSAAANVHGITTEKALLVGVPLATAISVFNSLAKQATKLVGHNIKYDIEIIQHELIRGGWPSRIDGLETFCTMEQSKELCAIPPTDKMVRAGITSYKVPKLEEAYRILLGKDLVGAHNALCDVEACKEVYFHLNPVKACTTYLPSNACEGMSESLPLPPDLAQSV